MKKLLLVLLCLLIAIPESMAIDISHQPTTNIVSETSTKETSTFFSRIASSASMRIMVIGLILGYIGFRLRKKSINRANQSDNTTEDFETTEEFQADDEESLKRREEKQRACNALEREIKARRRQYDQFLAVDNQQPMLGRINKKNAKGYAALFNSQRAGEEKQKRKRSRSALYEQELEKIRAKASGQGKEPYKED